METSVEKIAKLEADIEELKAKRNSTSNEVLQIAITNEITTIREQIIQQGNTQTISFPSLWFHLTNSFVLPSCSKLCIFNHIYISDYHSEFLSVPTGGAGTNSSSIFPAPYVHVVSFTISVHEGTTKLFPVFYRLFYFSPFCFCRSIFFLFHCITLHPLTSPYRMPFGTPFRPCRQSR